MFWRGWCSATFISSSILSATPALTTSLLHALCDCALSGSSFPCTESHCHLHCHLLPPVMYATTPFLLVPTALGCYCHLHCSCATPFLLCDVPVCSLLSPQSCRDTCALLSSAAIIHFCIATKNQRSLEFLGFGALYYLRRPCKSSMLLWQGQQPYPRYTQVSTKACKRQC